MGEEAESDSGDEIEYGLGQFASPGAIAHQLQGELVACWRCLPEDGRNGEAAIDAAREVFERSVQWWRRLRDHSTEAIAMALHEGLETPDVDEIDVEQTAEAYERLQRYNRDSSVRQAIFTCWCLLPDVTRSPGNVEQIMEEIFERTVGNFREDAGRFE
jgi:hypothetical protein